MKLVGAPAIANLEGAADEWFLEVTFPGLSNGAIFILDTKILAQASSIVIYPFEAGEPSCGNADTNGGVCALRDIIMNMTGTCKEKLRSESFRITIDGEIVFSGSESPDEQSLRDLQLKRSGSGRLTILLDRLLIWGW